MAHPAIVVLTAKPLEEIVRERASRDWRLDPERARQAEYLVCTQNQHNQGFRAPTAPHGSAFLIGRIAGVVPSWERPERWAITISEYLALNPPIAGIWGKSGNLRYPIWYSTLEELGIDLDRLPAFTRPAEGMAEMPVRPIVAPTAWTQDASDSGAWRRLDAILAQLDRVPDLPTQCNPLEWDEHGLPK
jgi:hypothetical protein